ncbi:hypothetical protein GNF80_07865 [Clostridium perfringens]|nr:hypothetical protein [Clostridium perfringens]
MDYTISFLFILFDFFIFYFLGAYVNKISNQGIIFGIRVPIEFRSNPKIELIEKIYKKHCLIYCLIATGIALIISIFNHPASIIVHIYILLFALIIPYVKANKTMKRIKKELGWKVLSKNKIILSIDNKKEKVTLNLWWFSIPIYLGIVNLLEVITFYPKQITEIPMHFDFSGNLTSYASSNLIGTKVSVYMLPVFSLFTTLLSLFIIKYFVKKGTRLNGGTIASLIKEKKVFKREISSMLFFTSLSISSLFLFLTSIILDLIKVNKEIFTAVNILFLILIILIPLIFLFRILKSRNHLTSTNDCELYRDDDDLYKLGLFYYNPNDPAIMVEKRVGIGYDFNYATLPAKIFVIIICLILLISLIIPFFYSK